MHQSLILEGFNYGPSAGAHLCFSNVEKTQHCTRSSELSGVILEKGLIFIEILACGKEPGVVLAAPENPDLEIEGDVGRCSRHFLGVVIQPCSVYVSGSAECGCGRVVNIPDSTSARTNSHPGRD